MTDDEIRDRFSAFHDGELSSEESAVVRARLAESKELSDEYESFKGLMGGLAGMLNPESEGAEALPKPAATESDEPQVNLLAGVQSKLHKRSGGKFYKDRASRTLGTRPLEAMAAALLLVILVAWLGMSYVSGLRPADTSTQTP